MRASLFVFLALTTAACGGSTSDNSITNNQDAGTGTDDDAGAVVDSGPTNLPSSTFPATHTPLPQVKSYGGPVMKNAKFLAITFPDDDATSVASIEDFSTKIGQSTYWATIGKEYGVGAATSTAFHFATTLPSKTFSDDDIQAFVKAQITSGGLPPGDKDTLYALYYPAGYTITLPHNQGTSCKDFGAYHGEIQLSDGTSRPYAVMPRCPAQYGASVLDSLTGAASHEYFEAATDPFVETDPAYGLNDANGLGWYFLGGGAEVGDMCAGLGDVFYKPTDVGYLVQRMWSNEAAKASHDPCIPQGQTPYYNAAPVMPDTDKQPGVGTFNTLKLALNETKTIEVDLFSDSATSGPFDVSVSDLAQLYGSTPELDVSLDQTSGQNGQKMTLTITRIAKASQGISGFLLQSSLSGGGGGGKGNFGNLWVGVVE